MQPESGKGAWAEIDKLAGALIQKSAEDGKALPRSSALTAVLEANPELATRYETERLQRLSPGASA